MDGYCHRTTNKNEQVMSQNTCALHFYSATEYLGQYHKAFMLQCEDQPCEVLQAPRVW